MSIFLVIIHVSQPLKYKNIQPWKKQIHTNSLLTLFELIPVLIHVLSLNDLLNMKYQISVCFIFPLWCYFNFSLLLFFFTHKLSNPIKVWHLKGLDNGNSYNTYMHVFFSALESVCYMYKIDYKVLTILKTNLYHLRINNIYVHVLKAKSLDHFQCF